MPPPWVPDADMRLRNLLALVFAASALIVTGFGTLTASRYAVERAHLRAEARMADLAEHLRQLIDANIAERLGDMDMLASVARTTAMSQEARRAWVDALRGTFPAYAWIGFSDLSGRVVASTGGLLEGESIATRPWFVRGLEHRSVIDVHEAALLADKLPALPYGEPKRFVDVAAPLRDAAGAKVGVVGAHLSVRWMREMGRAAIASALAREPSVEAMILAGDGTIVLGPGDRRGERMIAELPALTALAAGAEQATTRGLWPDGRDYFTGASRARGTPEHPTLPWTVVVRQPSEVALAPSRALVLRLIASGAVLALVFALLGWWAAERLADPLRTLANAARRIGGTGGDMRLPAPRGYTEIGELTGALSDLLGRLGERDRALATANADLERRVRERTAQLVEARDRAEAAQAKAEAGERAKSEFLATMSHEVRTPLNAIKGFGDLLGEDGSLTPGQRRCVDRIRIGCEVLTTVVNDVLDYARVEAGHIAFEATAFAPRAFVEDTVELVRGLAEGKGLALRLVVEGDGALLAVGDVTRLRQVLLNLLNNAVKFTLRGGVAVVLAQSASADGVGLSVTVSDTGIGIAAEAQRRLFTRFVQADSSTTRRFGGTGLGLAIAKGLIEAMGGTIGLTSREGEGSTFRFAVTLPRADAAANAADGPATEPRAGAPAIEPATSGEPRARLLLVEDGALNQEIAQAVLERAGYRVDLACDGQEAVRMVEAQAYDLVLMDVEMPVMDGITATRRIRSLDGSAGRVPIVAMTAHVMSDQVAQMREAGADDYVGKPFDRAHLNAVIERRLAAA